MQFSSIIIVSRALRLRRSYSLKKKLPIGIFIYKIDEILADFGPKMGRRHVLRKNFREKNQFSGKRMFSQRNIARSNYEVILGVRFLCNYYAERRILDDFRPSRRHISNWTQLEALQKMHQSRTPRVLPHGQNCFMEAIF